MQNKLTDMITETETIKSHTPGPWRWEINLKSKRVELCGGKPRFDLTVLHFSRWGMSGAKVDFLQRRDDGLTLIEPCEKFAVPIEGREHHREWCQTINHPDANLIAAAPDLLAALEGVVKSASPNPKDHPAMFEAWETARAAIEKAKGSFLNLSIS